MHLATPNHRHTKHCHSAYTLAELMLLVALAAILVAIFVDIRRRFVSRGLYITPVGLALSADGKRVAAKVADGLRVWDASSGAAVATITPPSSSVITFALSPDGSRVAAVVEKQLQEHLIVTDVRTNMTVCVRNDVGWLATFSADSKKLAYLGPPSGIDRVAGASASTDPRIIDLENPVAPDTAVASPSAQKSTFGPLLLWFGADDKTVNLLTCVGELKTWTLDSGKAEAAQLVDVTEVGSRFGYFPAYFPAYFTAGAAPDGRHFAAVRPEPSSAKSGGDWLVDLLDADSVGSAPRSLRWSGDETHIPAAAFVDSGKTLAVINAQIGVELRDVATLARQKVVPSERTLYDMASTPDDRTLAVAGEDAIYMLEGDNLRKIVDLRPATSNLIFLVAAFVVVFAVWVTVRRRRSRSESSA
jgi:hypothetical protein